MNELLEARLKAAVEDGREVYKKEQERRRLVHELQLAEREKAEAEKRKIQVAHIRKWVEDNLPDKVFEAQSNGLEYFDFVQYFPDYELQYMKEVIAEISGFELSYALGAGHLYGFLGWGATLQKWANLYE